MFKFLLGVVVGIIGATVGFTGLAKYADDGVAKVQDVARDVSQSGVKKEVNGAIQAVKDNVPK